ncbi:MAG: hypothetical protein Kow0047_14720 [Anaerolineae bacterium]
MEQTAATEIPKRPRKTNWAPYLLILPSLIYLAMFFAWPMARGLVLAVWDEKAHLRVWETPSQKGRVAGKIRQGTEVDILGEQGNVISPEEMASAAEEGMLTETWFYIRGQDPDGNAVEGWVPEARVRVRQTGPDGTPLAGTIRPKLGANVDPLTDVYDDTSLNANVIGKLAQRAEVEIADLRVLELWFLIRGESDGKVVEGWAPSRHLRIFSDGTKGRVEEGDAGELTTRFIEKMINDRFFMPALTTTLLLMVIIIPTQFVLAIIMALVIQSRIKGNTLFLYIFSIPLAVSDLAVGLVFYSIFTQSGYLNSILQGLGLINQPLTYLSANTRHWIIVAIWLAEVWRATSLVMVIVVAGLQGIPEEVLEAAEVFGANLWQRVRHVTIPLLKPSLQVALILRTILALQVFAVVVALSGGDIVTVLANETYRQYSQFRNPNVAAAYAGFILILSMISASIYLRMVRSHEELAS